MNNNLKDLDITSFDITIVGGGPSGMCVALSLAEISSSSNILLIDDGKTTEMRDRYDPYVSF